MTNYQSFFLGKDDSYETAERYTAGDQQIPYLPTLLRSEYSQMARRSMLNMCGLVVNHFSNALAVASVQGTRGDEAWAAWEGSNMRRLHRTIREIALKHGSAYVIIHEGSPRFATVHGPDTINVEYDDPINDLWPSLVRVATIDPDGRAMVSEIHDGVVDNRPQVTKPDGREEVGPADENAVGINPVFLDDGTPAVIRFQTGPISSYSPSRRHVSDSIEPRAWGKVIPLLNAQDGLNQARLDLSLARTFGAFNLRYISGVSLAHIDPPSEGATQEEIDAYRARVRREKIDVMADRMLMLPEADSVNVGSLPGTDIRPYIENVKQEVMNISSLAMAASSLPHADRVNLSAEAIAAERAPEDAEIASIRDSMSEGYERVLDLLMGGQGDLLEGLEINYRELTTDSLLSRAMAYAALVRDVGVNPQAVIPKIPGFSQVDIERAEDGGFQTPLTSRMAASNSVDQILGRQASS